MRERESFRDPMKLTLGTFKEDAENSLNHMKDLIQLIERPFQRAKKSNNEAGTNHFTEEEA